MILKRTYPALLLILLISLFQCKKKDILDSSSSAELQDWKEYPNDLFSFQRSFPYKKLDIKAYERGVKEALLRKSERNTSPGFDAAWVNQGPGNAGGRANAIEVHPSNENIIYLGFAGGGVFKTTDGGTTWNPIFDDQPFLAIGEITMDPNDSETIYVGTGDPNITGYPAIGNGVYKSTDGGNSWTHLGLADQRIVSRIMVDPSDSDVIYVACMGLPFERNNDRGLYKSVDGGANWDQVLFVSNQAGIIDLVINPDNPQILYAASWDRIRNNEESIAAGPNALIHKTTDGGDTWSVLTNGLPTGNQGRIGLAMAKSDSDILVCMYVGTNQKLQGIYRTEDEGVTWTEVSTSTSNGLGSSVLGGFGWYFGQIRIHPVNDDWIYLLGVSLWFTSSNGNFWITATNGSQTTPHVDHHDLVFNFQNDIVLANDGGAYKKESNSSNYIDIENVPATQIYRVAYDPHHPDDYYGGTQDNGTQTGNASNMNAWSSVLGGDGFQMRFHPTDPSIVFAETQNGNIFKSTSGLSGFISSTSGINPGDRKHWDMQYIISPHDPDRMYTGTYRVYKSQTSGALFWNTISPDLTDGNIYGSSFHTISSLDESPLVENLLYVGTTDGNVWRTEDGGTNWDSLHATLPERYITSVKASPDLEDNVYVTVSGYRYNEFIPRVYKSTDKGDNWTSIAGNLPDLAVNDIVILPGQNDQILFVATDAGIYATTNGGVNWELLGTGMPMVTAYDMEWNEANNELVAGTFARSIYSYPIDSLLNNLDPTITIAGQVKNQFGAGIDSVDLSISGDVNLNSQTDANGDYEVSNLLSGTQCEIRPTKDINIRNGLSTIDIVTLQKHILFIDTLDSPYKIIAGDINQSNTVSTFDLVIIRKVILFDQDTFINTDSWRFIPADFVFTNPIKPFLDDFPEMITCEDIQNGASPDFIGLKVGDVTANANPGMYTGESDTRDDDILELTVEDQLLKKGELYQIPIYAEAFEEITGFQMGLKINDKIVLESLESGGALDFDEQHYFLNSKNELRISWSNPYSVTIKKEDAILYLSIQALEDILLSEAIAFKQEVLRAEAYNKSEQIFEPQLLFKQTKTPFSKEVSLAPNPFSTETSLRFELTQAGDVSLTVYDLQGRLVFNHSEQLSKGLNNLNFNAEHLKVSGVYFYELRTNNGIFSGKLVKE